MVRDITAQVLSVHPGYRRDLEREPGHALMCLPRPRVLCMLGSLGQNPNISGYGPPASQKNPLTQE